jgi:hypothetical protein
MKTNNSKLGSIAQPSPSLSLPSLAATRDSIMHEFAEPLQAGTDRDPVPHREPLDTWTFSKYVVSERYVLRRSILSNWRLPGRGEAFYEQTSLRTGRVLGERHLLIRHGSPSPFSC